MLSKLCLASFLAFLTIPQTSWGQSGCLAKAAVNGKETVAREFHPAGPTTRREWRKNLTEQPYRIQYERIRPGHVLVGQARLIHDQDGVWYVESSNKKRLKLLGRNEKKTKTPKTFTEDNQIWRICVIRQEIPITQQGIATESEPTLDLALFLR